MPGAGEHEVVYLVLLVLWISLEVAYGIQKLRGRPSRFNPYFLFFLILLTATHLIRSNRSATMVLLASACCILGAMLVAFFRQKRAGAPS